jgi:CpeT protein
MFMDKNWRLILFFLFVVVVVAVSVAKAQSVRLPKDKDLKKIAKWMTGTFDTFAQVEQDEAANAAYQHTRALVWVVPVEIKGFDANGIAFYVENQAANARNKPYRQRVYFLNRVNGKPVMQIYKIRNDSDFVNAYARTDKFKNLTFDRLTRETGCDITFEKKSEKLYVGTAGEGRTCKSNLRGATYALSKTELSPNKWINLDQGFDDDGAHKWGPPPGTIGHIFLRRK